MRVHEQLIRLPLNTASSAKGAILCTFPVRRITFEYICDHVADTNAGEFVLVDCHGIGPVGGFLLVNSSSTYQAAFPLAVEYEEPRRLPEELIFNFSSGTTAANSYTTALNIVGVVYVKVTCEE